jgi:hypothetical protein
MPSESSPRWDECSQSASFIFSSEITCGNETNLFTKSEFVSLGFYCIVPIKLHTV